MRFWKDYLQKEKLWHKAYYTRGPLSGNARTDAIKVLKQLDKKALSGSHVASDDTGDWWLTIETGPEYECFYQARNTKDWLYVEYICCVDGSSDSDTSFVRPTSLLEFLNEIDERNKENELKRKN